MGVQVEQGATVPGERAVRVVPAAVAAVVIFMSMITETPQTMGAFHGPKTFLEAWKWIRTGALWIETGDIKNRVPIEWLPGQACTWSLLSKDHA